MAHKVLILDDDVDFNSLLTDIFEQADYIVTSILDPFEAVEVFKAGTYDLIVTDYKMPEMSGSEFMHAAKQFRPEIPVIMVSGYLENDTIRELIGAGVGGVFLKPLNIFSLLERTSELIEESRKQHTNGTGAATGDAEGLEGASVPADAEVMDEGALGFAFRSFACKCTASQEFAERLHQLRNFKSTISLIGEPGTHFRQICEDLRGFYDDSAERFVYVEAAEFRVEETLERIHACVADGAKRITFVILDIASFSEEQRRLAVSLAKCDGPFAEVALSLRVIFCMSGDLDSMYDEGLIDENLYILMGTAEVVVPALREVAIDLPFMAQQILAGLAKERGLSAMPRLDKAAREFVRTHRWLENYQDLYRTLRSALDLGSGDVLREIDLKASVRAVESASPRMRMIGRLSAAKIDFVRAIAVLQGGDYAKTADFFDVEPAIVEATIK